MGTEKWAGANGKHAGRRLDLNRKARQNILRTN